MWEEAVCRMLFCVCVCVCECISVCEVVLCVCDTVCVLCVCVLPQSHYTIYFIFSTRRYSRFDAADSTFFLSLFSLFLLIFSFFYLFFFISLFFYFVLPFFNVCCACVCVPFRCCCWCSVITRYISFWTRPQ